MVSSCAAHRSSSLSSRFVRGIDVPAEDMVAWPVDPAAQPAAPQAAVLDTPSEPVAKTSDLPTVEATDAVLARTLARLGARRAPPELRQVAAEYRRLGVYDRAHDYLVEALALDPSDGATRVALAQVWRDWGVPSMALSEAYRAVHAAPASAAAHNTLGILLFSLGDVAAAEARFERVLELQPGAAWAHGNLCYVAFSRGDERRALRECREAIRMDPALTAARNNLALVHAAAGRWAEAADQFALASGDAGRAQFNLGLALMAGDQYLRAADAFDAAGRAQPALEIAARQRASEARRMATAAGESVSGGRD
jgi:tetratricopeptide (TPR) repeat protein